MPDLDNWDNYDLSGCLEYNPQPAFTFDDIEEVLATVEGQKDHSDWYWLLKLNLGRYAYLTGGCDYTGWDCQSWAESVVGNDPYTVISDAAAGTGEHESTAQSAQRNLLAQLTTQNIKTVRERIGDMLEREATKPIKQRRLIRTPRRRF